MRLARFLEVYSGLISTASISSLDASIDQSNKALVDKLAQWFSELGFAIELTEVKPGKYNLLAKLGEGEGGLLLAGHTDTVPFDENGWQFDPFRLTEKDNRFYGLGTADMKGFFAFVYEAAKNMDWRAQQKPLYVLATCDEEISMLGARHFALNTPYKPDYCIIGEPTSLVPVRAHKGHIANIIRITGKSGHASDPSLGVNAIEIMHEVLFSILALRDTLVKKYHHPGFAIPSPTLNLGHIHGGDSVNRICGCCELHYEIRPLPGMSLDGLENMLREALKEVQQRWPNRLEIVAMHEPILGYECEYSHAFVGDMQRLSGKAAETVNYCTEAPFLQHLCPTLVLGPGSIEQAHQPNEYLSLDFIDPTLQLLSNSMRRYCC